jgi:PhnB protein
MAEHKMSKTKPVPEGFHTVTPALMVEGAARFIDFTKRAFGAKELSRMEMNGKIMHAAIRIGDSIITLGDAQGGDAGSEMQARPASLMLYVEDADTVFKRAMQAGATQVMGLADQFWGDRGGLVADPFGNRWWILTHMEDLSRQQLEERAHAFMEQQAKKAAA